MIPKIPKREAAPARLTKSRYDSGFLSQAIDKLNEIAKESNRRTETERRVRRMLYSIGNDFRDGFRGRAHGDDALSVAKKQVEWLLPQIERERNDAKVAQLRAEVEVIRELLMHKEQALAEADNSRGSSVFHRRQMEIRRAMSA